MNQEKLLRERISKDFEEIIKLKKTIYTLQTDIHKCEHALFKLTKNGYKETTTNNDGNIPERPKV